MINIKNKIIELLNSNNINTIDEFNTLSTIPSICIYIHNLSAVSTVSDDFISCNSSFNSYSKPCCVSLGFEIYGDISQCETIFEQISSILFTHVSSISRKNIETFNDFYRLSGSFDVVSSINYSTPSYPTVSEKVVCSIYD